MSPCGSSNGEMERSTNSTLSNTRTKRVESIEVINSIEDSTDTASPRVRRVSSSAPIFDGSFSATSWKTSTTELTTSTYNTSLQDIEQQRTHNQYITTLDRQDLKVSESIVTSLTPDMKSVISLSFEGMISTFQGCDILNQEQSVNDNENADMLSCALDSAISFIMTNPQKVYMFSIAVSSDSSSGRYINLICASSAGLIQSVEIALRVLYFIYLALNDTAVVVALKPSLEHDLVGACQVIQRAIIIHNSDCQVLDLCLVLICILSSSADYRAYFSQPLVVESIVAAASNVSNEVRVAELVCKAMCILATGQSDRSVWVASGAFVCLENMLSLYISSEVVEWICRALYSLTEDCPDSKVALVETALPNLLVDAISNHRVHTPATLSWGCRCIGSMAFQCSACSILFADAIPLLVDVLEQYGLGDEVVAESGCFALSCLGHPVSQNQDIMKRCGVADALLMVLRLHNLSIDVVRECCIAIRNMCLGNDNCQEFIGMSTDTCQILIEAILELHQKKKQNKKIKQIPELLRWIWYAICGLSLHQGNRFCLLSSGVGSVVVKTLKSAWSDSGMYRWVFNFLVNFSTQNDMHFNQLSTFGVCIPLASTLNDVMADADAVNEGCLALGRLASDSENRLSLGENKACEVVIQATNRHEDNMRVIGSALLAVVNLCVESERNMKKFVSCGVCKVIPRVMSRHSSASVPIAMWGCKAISLLGDFRKSSVSLCSSGACGAVLMAFNTHTENIRVIGNICLAIESLSFNQKNAEVMRVSGVCEMMANIAIVLLQHDGETSAIVSCLSGIRNMLIEPESRSVYGGLGAGEVVCKITNSHIENCTIVTRAFGIVCSLVDHSVSNLIRMGKSCVCECVALALTTHSNDADVVVAVSSVICSLMGQGLVEDRKSFLEKSDMLTYVMPMYTIFCGNSTGEILATTLHAHFTVDLGCQAVTSVVMAVHALVYIHCQYSRSNAKCMDEYQNSHKVEQTTEENSLDFENENNSIIHTLFGNKIYDSLCALLNLYCLDDDEIMQWTLRTISLLCECSVSYKREFGQGGACEAVFAVLKAYEKNELIQFLSLSAVFYLSKNCFNNALRFIALGAIDQIVKAINIHKASERVNWVATRAIGGVSEGHNMVSTSIYLSLVCVLSRYISSERVCIAGCCAISSIELNIDNTEAPFTSTASQLCRCVASALSRHAASADLSEAAALALYHLGSLTDADDHKIDRKVILRTIDSVGACKYLVYAILRHTHSINELVIYNAVRAIQCLSTCFNDAEKCAVAELLVKFRNVGVGDAIVSAVQCHMGSSSILCVSLDALSNLADDKMIRAKLGSSKTCDMVIDILHAYQQNERIIESACRLISVLCDNNKSNSKYLSEVGACELLVWSLDTFRGNVMIAKYVCAAVAFLAELNVQVREQLGACNGCEVIGHCMQKYVKDRIVAECGCFAVGNLAEDSPNNITSLGDCGACGVIVEMMEFHQDSEIVAWRACRALTVCAPYVSASINKSLSTRRIQKAVMDIAHNFESSSLVALWSSRALNSVVLDRPHPAENSMSEPGDRTCDVVIRTLAAHMNTRVDIVEETITSIVNILSVNAQRLVSLDVCDLLQRALITHYDHVNVILACFRAICALEEFGEAVRVANIPRAVVEAMKRHMKSSESVLEWGCLAISSMVDNHRNKEIVVSSGACEVVVASLQRGTGSGDTLVAAMLHRSIGSQSLALAACTAVHKLGMDNDANRERLGTLGACEAVTKVLQKYADSDEVAGVSCRAVATLSQNDDRESTMKLINAGVCKLVVSVLQCHHSSRLVALWGCRAVDQLSNGRETVAVKMSGSGVCAAVVACMQGHPDSADVITAGCKAIRTLSRFSRNVPILGSVGACDVLVFAIHLCFFDEATVEAACIAVSRLARDFTNAKRLCEVDTCTALVCVVCRHNTNLMVSRAAWEGILALCHHSDGCKAFADAGLCQHIAGSFLRTADGEEWREVVRTCLNIIPLLCTNNPSTKALFIDNDILEGLDRVRNSYINDNSTENTIPSSAEDVKSLFLG